MSINEENLKVIDRCRRDTGKLSNTIAILHLLVYNSTVQYTNIAIIVYDSK